MSDKSRPTFPPSKYYAFIKLKKETVLLLCSQTLKKSGLRLLSLTYRFERIRRQ